MLKFRKNQGFTLIELMIVVAILGILAAVAIPAFMNYIKKSKTSEAAISVKSMYTGAVTYYSDEHTPSIGAAPVAPQFPSAGGTAPSAYAQCDAFPATATGAGAGTPSTDKNRHIIDFSDSADADVSCFDALDFGLADPTFFVYTYIPATSLGTVDGVAYGDYFDALAYGDLDGDSNLSTFARRGAVATGTGNVGAIGGLFTSDRIE